MSMRNFLTFKSGGIMLACDFEKIVRIEPVSGSVITPAPGFPSYMPGTAAVGGEIMPVINSALRFGFDDTGDKTRACFITAEFEKDESGEFSQYGKCALTADEVTGSVRLDEEELLPPPSINEESFAKYLSGAFRYLDSTYYIIDPTKVVGEK